MSFSLLTYSQIKFKILLHPVSSPEWSGQLYLKDLVFLGVQEIVIYFKNRASVFPFEWWWLWTYLFWYKLRLLGDFPSLLKSILWKHHVQFWDILTWMIDALRPQLLQTLCFLLLVVRLSLLISLLSRLMLQLFKCQMPALTEACFDRDALKGARSPQCKVLTQRDLPSH